jgi:hypothetical protein
MLSNPYQPWLANVHARRFIVLFIYPLFIPFALAIIMLEAAICAVPTFVSQMWQAVQDPNSYDA